MQRHNAQHVPRPPLYPVDKWNCFEAVLLDNATTNNANEGWHRAFNSTFPKARMQLSQFVIRLKNEEEETEQMARRLVNAMVIFNTLFVRLLVVRPVGFRNVVNPAEPVRGRKKAPDIVHRAAQVKRLVADYGANAPVGGRIRFLRSIQYHMAKEELPPESDGSDDEGQ